MTKNRSAVIGILILLAAAVSVAVPLCTLFDVGSYLWCGFNCAETKAEWVEIAVLAAVVFPVCFFVKDNRRKAAALFGITCVFSYIHVDLLPFFVTGAYFAGILLSGGFVRGVSVVILSECALSLFKIGSPLYLRIFLIALFAGNLIYRLVKKDISVPESLTKHVFSKEENFVLAVVFLVFLVQVGRLNGTIDFDSQWYGVRSASVLAPGEGIYQDFGLLGMVYTYSKGYEVLTLPVSDFRSYGYIQFVNVWVFLYGLYRTYTLAKKLGSRKCGLSSVLLSALVPGIVCMSVSAKPDMLTWALQLVMLDEFFAVIKEEKGSSMWKVFAACALSFACKPTAVVFSTALAGMMFLYTLVAGLREKTFPKMYSLKRPQAVFTFAASLFSLAGIWGRSVKLTGLPFTSVFSGLLTKLGFSIRYPFPEKALPQNYQDRSAVFVLFERVWRMLLCPDGKDMRHVIIAWGGGLFFFILVILLIACAAGAGKRAQRKHTDDPRRKAVYSGALTVFIPFIITCLVSLSMLYQVDGNYFITLYSILILLFVTAANETFSGVTAKTLKAALVPVLVFQFLLMTATNWASYNGFTPFRLNKGSYNHIAENKEYFESARRAGDTWNILAEAPLSKVIAFAEHPRALRLPGVVQSFEDTYDSWGNPEVVSSTESYLSYMKFQGTDLIYVDPDYFAGDTHQRAKKILDGLFEKGILTEVAGDYVKLYIVEFSTD